MTKAGEPAHILVIVPNWVGDAVMATPALRALRRRFPEARLSVMGRPGMLALLEGLPAISDFHELPGRSGLGPILQSVQGFRQHPPDVAVVLPHSFRAALTAWFSKAPLRWGYARGGRFLLLTHRLQPHRNADGRVAPEYMAHEYLKLVAALGAADDNEGLELHVPEAELAAMRARVGTGPVVGLAPGAAFGSSKRWPAERFAQTADMLAERGVRSVLIAGPGEEALRQTILDTARHPIVDLAEPPHTFARLKAAIASVDLLVSNDSGPRHVAIAFKKPVVCIMGPTASAYSDGPWERGEILRVPVDCAPCQKRVCPTDHRCMTAVTPAMAAAAVFRHLR